MQVRVHFSLASDGRPSCVCTTVNYSRLQSEALAPAEGVALEILTLHYKFKVKLQQNVLWGHLCWLKAHAFGPVSTEILLESERQQVAGTWQSPKYLVTNDSGLLAAVSSSKLALQGKSLPLA